MSFGLPPLAVLAGVLALAALLYLLQRLSARRQVVFLPAAALWARALRDTPLRVRGSRFRYWLAYLLALAIVVLLWLAVAHPTATAIGGGATRIFYLDLSAGLTAPGEAARAERALLADVRATTADRRAVYLYDGTLLLAPGESASLLSARLDGVGAAARPSAFAGWLAGGTERWPFAAQTTVRYYGDWPDMRAAEVRANGAAVEPGYLAHAVPENRGIVALGASPAASGQWRAADVIVRIGGPGAAGLSADALRWTLDGRSYMPGRQERIGRDALLVRDVPAAGGELRVRLAQGDGFPADDEAAIRLPDRRPVRVAVGAGVPPAVLAAIRADNAFEITQPARAQVVVRRAGDPIGQALPALVLVPMSRQAATFLFAEPGAGPGGDLAGRLDELGLAGMDASALANALGRPISVATEPAGRRSISIWPDLLDPRAGFVRTAAMPLFVSQGLRWLAGTDGWIPYAKASAALPDQSRLYGLAGRPVAGPRGLGDDAIAGAPMVVSLTDRRTTRQAGEAVPPAAGVARSFHALADLPFVLLLAACVLLAGEWVLVQRGDMP